MRACEALRGILQLEFVNCHLLLEELQSDLVMATCAAPQLPAFGA